MTAPTRAIEAGARAIVAAEYDDEFYPFETSSKAEQQLARRQAEAMLVALAAEGFVVVPTVPTEAMWGGLARDLIMWDRGLPNRYGSTLYKHLRACGRQIPDWLLAEIPDIDHTPPKGTVAVCVYRAMIAAVQQEPSDAKR